MTKLIPLSHEKFAVIDEADYEWVAKWRWFYGGKYAQRIHHDKATGRRKAILMHRAILAKRLRVPYQGNWQCDHINGDQLDNRRCNLRKATKSQNQQNTVKTKRANSTSNYKGVSFNTKKTDGKIYTYWRARIHHAGRTRFLGSFNTAEEAARAYDTAARQLFGDFARLNFPDE